MTRSKVKTLFYQAESSLPELNSVFFRRAPEHLKKLHKNLHLTPINSGEYIIIKDTIVRLELLLQTTRERLRTKGKSPNKEHEL